MIEKSNNDVETPEFKKIIADYTDDEIRKVLKKRKLYQKDAADFAIQEAIRRGIIFSEQDLFAKEYKHEPNKFSLFPTIENDKARVKFKKSISRSLLILGAIPMVFGGIEILESQSFLGIVIFIFGVVWSFTSYQIMQKEMDKKLVSIMFLLLFLAVGYIAKMMISIHYLTTIDILVTIIGVGFVLYGIGFLSKLKD